MRTNLLLVVTVVIGGTAFARADLIDAFNGFDTVWEVGVSGLESSYHADTIIGQPISGATTANFLPTLGPERMTYPFGVGQVPSPGGCVGRCFDQGVLGVKADGRSLVIQLANGLDPLSGYYHSGWKTWYGQGDLFVDVEDSTGIGHYALLNTWARDGGGDPIELNRGHFSAAQAFHVSGGAGGTSLEGHLIRLGIDEDVTLTGGRGSYHRGIAPNGLDLRTYAQGGVDLGDAGLTHGSLVDLGQTWYLQTWTIDLGELSSDASFDIAMHAVPSCGNDQIGDVRTVPEPSSLLLVLSGAGILIRFGRLA